MDGGHGYGNHTLYLDNHTAVASTLHFQENSLLPRKVTAGDTDFRAFRQVQFIRLEIQEMVVISASYGNEALHLTIRDDYLSSAAGIGDVLQVTHLRLHTFYIRRTGMNKNQVVDNRNQNPDFPAFLQADLILHRDETAQILLFKKTHGIRLPTVGGTHSVPDFRLFFSIFFRFHSMSCSEKGCSSGALTPLHTLEFQSLANTLCKIRQALCSSCLLIFRSCSLP